MIPLSASILALLLSYANDRRVISPIPATLEGHLSARLINDSPVPIVAVVVFFRVHQPNGVPISPLEINQDFYTDEAQIPAHGTGVVRFAGIERIADLSKPAIIEVDAVMYSDGSVVGANTFGIDKYMHAKWDAKRRIAQDILRLNGKEEQIKSWLDLLESSIPENNLQPDNWQFYRHHRAIARAWAAMYSAMLNEDRVEFWKQVERFAKGER